MLQRSRITEIASSPGSSRFWLYLVPIILLFAVQGGRLAHTMVTWTDESGYLHLGYLAASGRISVYQDEIVATRMPLPFYVLGMTQVIWGRSLLVGRSAGIAFGIGAVILVAVIARRLGGERAGLLAAAFFATQGVLVGYLATATYYSLSALILLSGLALLLCRRGRESDILATAILSLLVLTRTNLWAIPPVALLFVLCRARTQLDRAWLLIAATAAPLAFFGWDTRHLKVFAYLPLLRALVEPLGFRSTLDLTAFQPFPLGDWPLAALRLARMYEYWMLAGAALVGTLVFPRARQCWKDLRQNQPLLLLTIFFFYVSAFQLVVFLDRLKQYAAYFPSWAPILAVLLGTAYSLLFSNPSLPRRIHRGLIVIAVISLAAPIVVVRHPLLPSDMGRGLVASESLRAAAAHFERIIPPNARVFLWGNSLPLYLAARDPYLQQIYSNDTLAAVEDRSAIPTHGLWGLAEIERWLSDDADYVVIQSSLWSHYQASRPAQVERIRTLLSSNFELIGHVDDYPWFVFDVYARAPGRPTAR